MSDRPSLGEFGDRTVMVIRSVETGEERVLLSDPGYHIQLHWSPDGRSILYGAYWEPLRLIDVKAGHITEIAKPDTWIFGRVWSPDGKTIYYVGTHSIVALDVEKRQKRELYAHGVRNGTGRWLSVSPDGRQLAFVDRSYGVRRLKVITTAGGEPSTLFNLEDQDLGDENEWLYGPLAWTPDGRHLLFVSRGRLPSSVWRVPVEGGEPQKLMEIESPLELGIDTIAFSLNPDGKRIAFHNGESSQRNLWVMENLLSKFKAGE